MFTFEEELFHAI